MSDDRTAQAQETEQMTRQALLEARYELGVAASYADDPESSTGLRTHGRACAKVLVKIDAALALLAAQPRPPQAQPEPSIVERLILQWRAEEADYKRQAAAQAPMGGSLYVRYLAQWELAKRYADELEAAFLRDRSVMDGQAWQPIATAPKDGTRVLVWAERERQLWVSQWVARMSMEAGWAGARLVDAEPTHWMPLPTPPVPSGAQE